MALADIVRYRAETKQGKQKENPNGAQKTGLLSFDMQYSKRENPLKGTPSPKLDAIVHYYVAIFFGEEPLGETVWERVSHISHTEPWWQ